MNKMDGFEDQKIPRNIVVAENDSILDFKSPERFVKPNLTEISNFNVQQRKRTVTKSKKSIKSHKEMKGKQYVEKKKSLQESQPSIESSFFKSKSSGEEKDCTSDTKLALVCPLCFKTFKDLNSHTLHMKICAYKNNVPTKKLLDAIELQKRQEDERKSLGLLAAPVVQDKKKSSSSRRASSCEETDFQLALALSKSLQEAEELDMINEIEGLPRLSNQFISTANVSMNQLHEGQLEKFGFANSKPPSLIRNKKKRRNEITSLQVRSQEERNRILTERISEILMGNEPITQIQNEEIKCDPLIEKKTYLRSRILQKLCNKEETLWNKAKLTVNEKCFYVSNLSEYIVPEEEQIEEEIDSEFANTSNAYNTGLSQYEIKACSDEKVQQIPCTELYIINENCENCQNRQFVNTVVTNWSTALNDSSASDIVIFVNNEKHIWAHKLVFYVQCSNILLDVTTNDTSLFTQIKEKISWTDISYNIALAFLEFIYCGIIERYLNVFEDLTNFSSLRNLARKYKVKELFGFLQMKEIQMKQARNQVYNVHKKELIFKKTDKLNLNEHNVENLDHTAKDSKLNESEKLNEQHSEKVHAIDKSEFIDIELKKNTFTEDLWKEEINISQISALRTINVSPDLFDDVNDTMKSNKEMQNNTEHYDEIINVGETSNVTFNRPELANQTTLDTSNSPRFENTTAFRSTEGDVNLSLGTSHSTTPKRGDRSNITKLKSNLSIFIEQFKRENAKSDSDTDSEISIQPVCSKLLRNPFNVRQDDSSRTETNTIMEKPCKEEKDILRIFDCMTDSKINVKISCDDVEDDIDANTNHRSLDDTIELSEFNLEECTRSDDNNSRNKNVMDADKELQDDVINSVSEDSLKENMDSSQNLQSENEDIFSQFDMSEVEMSMYSKYKKGHENNSIVNYRNFVQKHILRDNEKSNTAHEECEVKDNTDNISLLLDTDKDFELKTQKLISDCDEYKRTSPEDLCDLSNERATNEEQCLFNNIMSPINIAETTVKTRRMDTSNKLRYSKSDNNISLKSIKKNSFISEEPKIDEYNSIGSPILLSSSPEPDYDILNTSKREEGKIKKSASYSEKSINYSHIFATEIYLANVHMDNSNDNTNMPLRTKETNRLDEEIIFVPTTNENNKLSTTNDFFADKFKNNEKSLITKGSSRKFQRKSVSEANLNINTKNIKINIPESYNSSRYRRSNESYLKATTSSEIIRDNVTPPPDYDNMKTPELHAELNKYGLKIQKRKRAVKLLTYIYNELHPEVCTTSSDTESESDEPPSKKVNCRKNDDYTDNYESQLILCQENIDMELPVNVTDEDEQFDEPEFTSASDNPPNIKDTFLKLLTAKKELHNKVLAYEPLCINSLHSMLKAEGFKCKMNILMDFLDEQCITFYVQETRQKKDKVIST